MYFPKTGDVYVFRFSYGDVELTFVKKNEKGFCFFNNNYAYACAPMDATRFGFLIRKNLVGFTPSILSEEEKQQLQEYYTTLPKVTNKTATYKAQRKKHDTLQDDVQIYSGHVSAIKGYIDYFTPAEVRKRSRTSAELAELLEELPEALLLELEKTINKNRLEKFYIFDYIEKAKRIDGITDCQFKATVETSIIYHLGGYRFD